MLETGIRTVQVAGDEIAHNAGISHGVALSVNLTVVLATLILIRL
jgi:hypothetical protein